MLNNSRRTTNNSLANDCDDIKSDDTDDDDNETLTALGHAATHDLQDYEYKTEEHHIRLVQFFFKVN